MRYLLFIIAAFSFFSCKNEGGENTGNDTASPAERVAATPPPAAAPLPANLSLDDLRNEVRKVLRMQLPNTDAETRNGVLVRKGYSFDIEPYPATGRPIWVVQEKLYNSVTNEISTGGKYFCLWATVDANRIGYRFSDDGKKIALVIPAAERQSFIFHPYAQELSDEVVTEVVIGWYDRVQDATLARGLVALQTLAANMGKWEEPKR